MKIYLITIALLALSLSCGCILPYPVGTTVTETTTHPVETQYITVTAPQNQSPSDPIVTISTSTPITIDLVNPTTTTTPATINSVNPITPTTTPLAITSPTTTTPPSTSNIIPELKTVAVSDQLITRRYQWDYAGSEWTWEFSVRQSLYDYFKALPRSPTRNYSVYVTHPSDDKQIENLVLKLKEAAQQKGYNSFQTISFVAAFVQSLEYTSDSVTTGFDNYPRYPIETLMDNGGDCEDTAILMASLLNSMNYGVVLLVFSDSAQSRGHCAVGVKCGEGVYGTSWSYNGAKYYYLETTGTGWEIGQVPEDWQGFSANIYPMIPIPILTHDWESEGKVGYVQLTVKVSNLGSAPANSVQVYAGFDAGNNQAWNGKYSQPFDAGINETWTVTLNLKPAWGEYTRVLVQIFYNGYAVDESYGTWVQMPSY